jgi:CHASE3 domain sensor protein
MNPSPAFFLVAGLMALFVLALAWWQNRKLNQIHKLVNSRLSEALQTIEDLKGLLLQNRTADDPRIKRAITKNS